MIATLIALEASLVETTTAEEIIRRQVVIGIVAPIVVKEILL